MRFKASKFMSPTKSNNVGEIPTVVVSRRAGGSTSSTKTAKRDTFYNVGSLEAVVSTFDENERSLRKN